MDCGAATSDPSDNATLSQVNKWFQYNRAVSGHRGVKVQRATVSYLFVCSGCNKRRGGFERGGEGKTEGRAAQSQEEGENVDPEDSSRIRLDAL